MSGPVLMSAIATTGIPFLEGELKRIDGRVDPSTPRSDGPHGILAQSPRLALLGFLTQEASLPMVGSRAEANGLIDDFPAKG